MLELAFTCEDGTVEFGVKCVAFRQIDDAGLRSVPPLYRTTLWQFEKTHMHGGAVAPVHFRHFLRMLHTMSVRYTVYSPQENLI